MIFGDLRNSDRYEALNPYFKKAFDYIKSHDLLNADLGKIELDGDNLFIMNAMPDYKTKEEQIMEYHKKYLDIHVLLKGKERIGWKALQDCTQEKKSFDDENDYGLYEDKPTAYADLLPGQFAIVYPEDAHAPNISSAEIRKLVVKIKL